MDNKKFTVYSKRNILDLREHKRPSSSVKYNIQTNVDDSAILSSLNNTKNVTKSEQCSTKNTRNIWKNISDLFSKSNSPVGDDAPSVKMLKNKTTRGFTSLFKHPKRSSDHANVDITTDNMKATLPANSVNIEHKEMAMAIRLPTGTTADNVAVTIELEATKPGEEPTMVADSDGRMAMKRVSESESQTEFTGILRLSSDTDIATLANMPLYLIDSKEKLVLNPGTEISCTKRIRPSEDMLMSDSDAPLLVNDIKVKLKLKKVLNKKPKKKSKQKQETATLSINENKSSLIKKELEGIKTELDSMIEKLSANSSIKRYDDALSTSSIKELLLNNRAETEMQSILDELFTNKTFNRSASAADKCSTSSSLKSDKKSVTESKSLLCDKGTLSNKSLQTLLTKYNSMDRRHCSHSCNTSIVSEKDVFAERLKLVCERLHLPVQQNDLVRVINEIYNTSNNKLLCDSYTQYSIPFEFAKDEEIPAQYSLLETPYGNRYIHISPSTSSSSQLMYFTPYGRPSLYSSILQPSGKKSSGDTVLPKSTSTVTTNFTTDGTTTDVTTTDIGNLLETYRPGLLASLSYVKVPSNTPSSCTEFSISDNCKFRSVKNNTDLSLNAKDINKIVLNYKKSEKKHFPICFVKSSPKTKNQVIQTDNLSALSSLWSTEIDSLEYNKTFDDLSGTENELLSTEFHTCSTQTTLDGTGRDKTLDLLERAKWKLVDYLQNRKKGRNLTDSSSTDDTYGVSSSDTDSDGRYIISEIRNVSVSLNNNSFSPSGEKNKDKVCQKEQNKTCPKTYSLDGSKTELARNEVFQVYPLFNKDLFQLSKQEIKDDSSELAKRSILQSTEASDRKVTASELKSELDLLQQMYTDIRASMRSILDAAEMSLPSPLESSEKITMKEPGKIETIGDDLVVVFDEVKTCLSTINQILNESAQPVNDEGIEINNIYYDEIASKLSGDSESHQERQQTYFAMENEIQRTIKELLKESEYIREAVILNGFKEEAEPPFSFEYINNTRDPISICKKLFEDIFNSTTTDEGRTKTEECQDDIKYILNVLLEKVEKSNFFSDNPDKDFKPESNVERKIASDQTLHQNLQSGDVNTNRSVFGNENNQMVYFQHSSTWNSKIPKTSFSFGETPSLYVEVPGPNRKTPTRLRDGLTVTDSGSPQSLESSRIFTELINLQTNSDQPLRKDYTLLDRQDILCFGDGQGLQNCATATYVLENSIPIKDLAHYKPFNPFEISNQHSVINYQEENNDDPNDDQKANPGKNPQGNYYQNATQSGTGGIRRSQKAFHINKDVRRPLPIIPKQKPTRSTDEEEYMQDINLEKATAIITTDSSTEEELLITERVLNITYPEQSINETSDKSTKIHESEKIMQLTDAFKEKPQTTMPTASLYEVSTTEVDNEAVLKTLNFEESEKHIQIVDNLQASHDKTVFQNLDKSKLQSGTESEYCVPDKPSGFSKRSSMALNHVRATQQSYPESSSSDEESVSTTSRKPRSKLKKKDEPSIIEIKPIATLSSESDSIDLADMCQATVNNDLMLINGNSHIVLRQAAAVQNMQDILRYRTQEPLDKTTVIAESDEETIVSGALNGSNLSLVNSSEATSSEYDSDLETISLKIPNPKHRFKSVPELNTPEEIAKIEGNVRENDELERRTTIVLLESKSRELSCEFPTSYELYNRAPVESEEDRGAEIETPLSSP